MQGKTDGRWLLVLALSCALFSVLFAILAWWIVHDRSGITGADKIAVVGVASACGAAVGALFGQPLFGQWLAERRAPPGSSVPVAATMLDADRLAEAVKDQWTRAASERGLVAPSPIPVRWKRSSLPVAGPVSGAVGSKQIPARFPPLPGVAVTTSARLRSGQLHDLHAVYGGLASGRLVIIGPPGSGKTSAGVLLVLAALAHRDSIAPEDRERIPVPVMLTLQGWDPGSELFESWAIARLAETYPLFAGKRGREKASGLLSAGMLAVIIDGLDEIPSRLRPSVLRALSAESRIRIVLLTRSAEMVAAATEAHLLDAAALELQNIDARVVADYLRRVQVDPAPQGWRELIDDLRDAPGSSIAKALASPLAVTLLRDTYRTGDDVRELFKIASDAASDRAAQQNVEDHLLDRLFATAYAPRPGESSPPYDLHTAERALRYLASRMNHDGTRDLRWWLVPRWVPAAPRVLVTGVLGSPFTALLGARFGFTGMLVAGLAGGLLIGGMFGTGGLSPERRAVFQPQSLFRREPIMSGVGSGAVWGLLFWGLMGESFVLFGAVTCGFSTWVWIATAESVAETVNPLTPRESWRADLRFGVASMLLAMTLFALGGMAFLGYDPAFALVAVILTSFLGILYSETWPTRLAFIQLAVRHRTPILLMRFLEDARARGILRTVGPVYQFRHARLQDRLSGPA